MTDPLDFETEWAEVEALVQAAGAYVRPSDELRPRVLEAARTESRERRAQRRIWQLALAIAILGLISAATGSRWSPGGPLSASMLPSQPDARQTEASSIGWNTVDSFTELRRRQAALLSLTR